MPDPVTALCLLFGIAAAWAAWDHARHQEMRTALKALAVAGGLLCLAAVAAGGVRSPMDLASLPCASVGVCP